MNGLRIRQELVDGHLLLVLEGELSVLTSYTFTQTVQQTALEAGRYKLLFDTAQLQLIDSSGLGSLARLLPEVKSRGGCIHLVNIRANVLEMLYVARLDKAIRWYNSVEEALAACAAGEAEPAAAPASDATEVPAPPVADLDAGRPDLFGAALPRYGDCANYPTWCVLRWLRNNVDLRRRAAALVAGAGSDEEAAAGLAQLVGRSQADALEPTSLAAGLYSFVLRCVDWREIAGILAGDIGG